MGNAVEKRGRDPSSEEGEGGDGGPKPMKSPQTTPGKKSKVIERRRPPANEPGSPSTSARPLTVGDDRGGGYGGKENIAVGTDGASSPSDRPSKHPARHGGELIQVDEEEILPGHHTPVRMESHGAAMEPLTPLVINENEDVTMSHPDHHHQPQATSTPATNGQHVAHMPFNHEMKKSSSHTGSSVRIVCPDSCTDGSDDEAFSPNSDQQPPSPSASYNSVSTNSTFNKRSHSDSDSRRSEPNFGRFYNTSYLGLNAGKAGYTNKASVNAVDKKDGKSGAHFHRPPNFTYAKQPPTFLKKKGTGMSALTSVQRVVKVRRSSSPADLRNQEAVRMSMYPSAKPKLPDEPDKIERDDWPGPASPAAILPELLRMRKKRGANVEDEDDDEDAVPEDPRIQRELHEISKIKDESGIGQVIYRELEGLKAKPHQPLDPWKASRVPSAKFEPRYRTRFQSPMFASPSRFLDRPRYAWDDNDIRAYRSVSTLANLPTPKPGYGPSYMTPRAATLPLAGAYGARDDWRFFEFDESDDRPNTNLSSSTLTGDTSSRRHDSSFTGYDGPNISLLKLQKSTWHAEIEPPVYDYERLKITNFDLPKDVDSNHLEIHLTNEDFEELFKLPREKFYRMAEWKRNDVKRKLNLY